MKKNKSRQNHQLRIIAGQCRGQKITVIDEPDLRPTTDRVRETLFNWLNFSLINSRCLDAFAGSGILGFEALSRDAHSVTAIEQSKQAFLALKKNALHLGVNNYSAIQQDCLTFLQQCDDAFDIIFLDPPFNDLSLLKKALNFINNNKLLANKSLIYIELPEHKVKDLKTDFPELHWLKQKKAGQVCYALVQFFK